MAAGAAGAIIGGIISALGSLGSSASNAAGGIFQNRANMQIAKENRDFALEMWNRENEYNLPINQVKRYRDAGLNPALLAGQISPGNTNAPKSFNNVGKDYSYVRRMGQVFGDAASMVSMIKDIQIKKSQKDSIDADTNLKNIRADYEAAWNSVKLAIAQQQLEQLKTDNSWRPTFKQLEYDKGFYGNQILKYNADYTPTFLSNRSDKERKDLALKDWSLKYAPQKYESNAYKNKILQNEADFVRRSLNNRLLNLQLRNNLLNLQRGRLFTENEYLKDYLSSRNASASVKAKWDKERAKNMQDYLDNEFNQMFLKTGKLMRETNWIDPKNFANIFKQIVPW